MSQNQPEISNFALEILFCTVIIYYFINVSWETMSPGALNYVYKQYTHAYYHIPHPLGM